MWSKGKYFKQLKIVLTVVVLIFMNVTIVFAHPGRTDGSGGHKDNKNASGLGSYHYHHGEGPHLHPNGVCPYDSNSAPQPIISTPKKSIKIIDVPESLTVGSSKPIEWKTDDKFDKYQVEWSSSDSSTISVNGIGLLTALKPGKVTITGNLDNTSKNFTVYSKEVPVSKIQISSKPTYLEVGEKKLLPVKITPDNATDKSRKWTSSNTDVASITDSGHITPLKTGTTIIQAKVSNGIFDTFELTVTEVKPKSIETDVENVELFIGDIMQINAEVLPKETFNKDIEWIVSNQDIIQIDKEGKIKTVFPGITTLTLKCQDIIKEIPIKVNAIETSDVIIDQEDIPYIVSNIILVGASFTPEILILPQNATDKTSKLETDNPQVLKISGNKVEAIGSGQAVLTVVSGGISHDLHLKIVDSKVAAIGGSGMALTLSGMLVVFNKKRRRKNVNNH